MKSLTKKRGVIIGAIVVSLIVVGIIFFVGESSKIHKGDYAIEIGKPYPVTSTITGNTGYNVLVKVTVNKPIKNMSYLKAILNDIFLNVSNDLTPQSSVIITIYDRDYCINIGLTSDRFFSAGYVKDNVGTVNNPRDGEVNIEKLKELRVFLEEYNAKYFK